MTLLANAPLFVFYNGFTFPTETETVGVDIKPVPDSSGRTVKYTVYSITVKSVLGQGNQVAGMTVDAAMARARRQLTAYGGELHYESVGLGNLTINVPPAGPTPGGAVGPARDVVWGPKPTLLKWKPLGQMSAEITWQVDVAIPECDEASFRFALMEYCFKLTFDIDRHGYTRRTYTGFLAIPQTRVTQASRGLTDQADAYWESVVPAVPPGFQRASSTRTLSEDKCRLDFTVVDEELPPNVPPPGVVVVQCSHQVSTNQVAAVQWTSVLSARYEVARGVAPGSALNHFLQVARDRLERFIGQPAVLPRGKASRITAIPRAMTLGEPEVFGRGTANFSITHTLICGLADIVQASGLWRPAGGDPAAWAASVASGASHPRGNAKMRLDNGVDAIIDLCGKNSPRTIAAPPAPRPPTPPVIEKFFGVTAVSPESSYIQWNSRVKLSADDNLLELKRVPPGPPASPGAPAGYSVGTAAAGAEAFPPPSGGYSLSTAPGSGGPGQPGAAPFAERVAVKPSGLSVPQRPSEPSRYVYLSGYAARAEYPVEVPELVSVGGLEAVRACRDGEGVDRFVADVWFGVPIHVASWNVRYLLTGQVADHREPAHPYGEF